MKKAFIVIGVVLVALLVLSRGSSPASDAERVAEALNKTDERIKCEAKANAKTIMCLVHTSDSQLPKLAAGVVLRVNANDISLAGWKITMVNTNDYVVTRRF